MDIDSFSIPKSVLNDISKLKNTLSETERFVLLSGDSGSGRTSLCEHVVNDLDGKFTTVFIPCQGQMSLTQLRQLFLQQISPDGNYDTESPLSQTFESICIPVREKLLIVVDDLDLVVDTFTQDLFDLFEKNLGKNRFSILVTGHPLWAESKLNSLGAGLKAASRKIVEIPVTPLRLNEAMGLCEQMFVYSNLNKVYKAIKPELPKVLEKCNGNLTKIIKLSEALMADPAEVNSEKTEDIEVSTASLTESAGPKRRKSGGSGLFISIICILIVIACLIPVFLGSSFIDRILGRAPAVENENGVVNTQINLNETDKLTFGEDETVVMSNPEVKKLEQESPLYVAEGASEDISAKGPRGDEKTAVEDDGKLLEDVPGGVETEVAEKTTKNSVTIAGSDLEEIEKGGAEANSVSPRRGVAGSLDKKEEVLVSKTVVLKREDNSLHLEEIQREKAELEAQLRMEEEAKAFAKEQQQKELEHKLALEKQKEERRRQIEEAQIKALADSLAKQEEEEKARVLAELEQKKALEEKKAQEAKASESVKSTSSKAKPVEGALSELASKNPRHFTLQVQAGRNRASLVSASKLVDGTFWIYTTTRDGRDWYVLVLGDFASYKAASDSARKLPASLRANGPFAKSFDKVNAEIRAHN
ncbi:MAG: AAA family ATPase [Succinivibrio sp.]|nr:AAA family ATPase [Succinivibrio sp.]